MELLSPRPRPSPLSGDDGAPSPEDLRHLFRREAPSPAAVGDGVYVAVGRSPAKTQRLLKWTFRQFGCKEVGLLHVHQPSPMIPTILGKLPACEASEELISAYRREEREATKRTLLSYLNICYRAQVQANIIMTESEHIHQGIVYLVASHCIQKLVIGATPDNCFMVKGGSCKVNYTAKNAPSFCELWFISKGRHVWTREASESKNSLQPVLSPCETILRESMRSISSHDHHSERRYNSECFRSSSSTNVGLLEGDGKMVLSTASSSIIYNDIYQVSSTNSNTDSSSTSPTEINSKEELDLNNHFKEVMREIERLKEKAFDEQVRRKELESEAAEAFSRVKANEASRARVCKSREELEGTLKSATQQLEELAHQINNATSELENVRRTRAILDAHVQETTGRRDEVAAELDLVQLSIATFRLEREKIRKQRGESVHQPERWKCSNHSSYQPSNRLVGFGDNAFNFTNFSLSDLKTATCEFSESFKLGQGGSGCVYKGEMLNRSVAIKKLHPHNVQGQLEFQQEVHVLSKLRHPHLVTLIGVCPEALSLVYEYLPNGTLNDRLFGRTANIPLTWKVRTRIAAEMSSALLFLHSCKPEKIVHGDLKPENIFLDFNFNCKIGDFGICRLVPENAGHGRLFRWNSDPKGAYPYADPDYQRTGMLTPKSDIYSFGVILLQLLTGRPPLGLAGEVRRAISVRNLNSVLDKSAGEWPADVARWIAEFGLRCTEINGRDRPELMPEVVRELEQLHSQKERPVPPFFLCPILQEIMLDPQVAADGYTYEGKAIREWLENGRRTSPMTNLELNHLNLTPNNSLRFAIQDWLCGSSAGSP